MPWYWTDDIAEHLRVNGALNEDVAFRISGTPVAVRRSETSVEAAAEGMLEDDEIPLAA